MCQPNYNIKRPTGPQLVGADPQQARNLTASACQFMRFASSNIEYGIAVGLDVRTRRPQYFIDANGDLVRPHSYDLLPIMGSFSIVIPKSK